MLPSPYKNEQAVWESIALDYRQRALAVRSILAVVTAHLAGFVVGGYLPAWCWALPPLVLFAGSVVFCVDPVLQMVCSFCHGDLSRLGGLLVWLPPCVSLSVSCQWFYPMVGYVMLFYHRVEPRTGYRGTLCIEGLRLHSHKQPSSQGLAPLPCVLCWFSSSSEGL